MPVTTNDTITGNEQIILPLHNLVAQLRKNGFTIRPDDYIEMLKVVEKFGAGNLEDLAPWLCPLIATSPEEQERFYRVFEDYKTLAEDQPIQPLQRSWLKVKAHFKNYYKYWIAGLVIFLSVLFIYILRRPTRPIGVADFTISKLSAGDTVYRVGDSIQFDASVSIPAKNRSSENQFFWNTGSGFIEDSASIIRILQKQGPYVIQLKIRSTKFDWKDSIATKQFQVCQKVNSPQFQYEQQYTKGQKLNLDASNFKISNNFGEVYWTVNGVRYKSGTDESKLHLSFDSAGIYKIVLVGIYKQSDTVPASCNFVLPLEDITVNEEKSYTLNVSYGGRELTSLLNKNVRPFWNWLLLIPAISIALGTFLWWLRKKRKKDITPGSSLTFTGKKPPHETPFENKDHNLVQPEIVFREVFRSFRQKAEDELIAFNIPKSIYNTIRTGGIPDLVFTNKLRYNDYLFLIDSSHAKSMQVQLFDYLVRLFNEEAICVERYFYTGNFETVYNESLPNGISLKQLSERYKNFTLIILGSGHQLVYSSYPILEKNITGILHEWEHKAILTPIPYLDWNKKEKLITEEFVILPADIQGILRLIESIREKKLNNEKSLSASKEWYKTSGYDFEDIEDLETYISDKVVFQWLCAIAVFHKLRWEILIEIGKSVCAYYQQPDKVNYTNLLKISRISWMADGAFPADTRLELLKKLNPEIELIARQTLLQMMEYADTYFGPGYLFEQEKEIQKITSRFLLYASNPEQFSDYEGDSEKFKTLWETDNLWDVPQKVYLDNDSPSHWPSLLQSGNKTIGIQEYFYSKQNKEAEINRSIVKRNSFIAASLVVLLGLIHIGKNYLPGSFFVHASAPVTAQFSFTVNRNILCEEKDTLGHIIGFVMPSDGNVQYLTLNNSESNDTQQAFFLKMQLPVSDTNSKSLLHLRWDGPDQNKASIPIALNYEKLDINISACSIPKRYNVNVSYNDSSKRAEALRYASVLTNAGYFIDSIFYRPFTDSSHIGYFSSTDKAIADSMASLLTAYDLRLKTTAYTSTNNNNALNEKQFNLLINLKGAELVLTQLPSSTYEIWRGATNNRLIAIDGSRKIIYYSTGDKNTYGTYRINQVWKQINNVYRVITNADKQYAVFMIRAVQPNALELSFCPNRYNTIEEAKTVQESLCGAYNQVRPYFETNPNTIYFNFQNTMIPASQQARLSRITKRNAQYSNVAFVITPVVNRFYASNLRTSQNINNTLNNAGLQQGYYSIENTATYTGTPFDRSYLRISLSSVSPVQQKEPETLITYIALDEKNYPTQYVRLDWMSNLQTAMKTLAGSPNARLRFVAYYDSYSSPKDAEIKINNMKSFMQQQFGKLASSKQITYE